MKVLITGASSGLGKSFAYNLASFGHDLILVARRENLLKEIQKDIETKYNVKVKIMALDLLVEANILKMFNENLDVDIVINNAGIGEVGTFDEISLEKDINIIKLNVLSFHLVLKKYHELFTKNNCGYILNVASIASFSPGPKMATYYASKNYELALIKAIQYEDLKNKSKVKVSVLCPESFISEFDKNANVKHSLKGVSADKVAKKAIKAMLKGKKVIFPSFSLRIRAFFMPFISSNLLCKIVYKIQSSKEK